MKLNCSQSELNTALQLVSRAVASRPTHPVLANVLLTADAGTDRLSLTGFDLNLGIQTSLKASIETSGAVTLPAKLFGEIISKLFIEDDQTTDFIELARDCLSTLSRVSTIEKIKRPICNVLSAIPVVHIDSPKFNKFIHSFT